MIAGEGDAFPTINMNINATAVGMRVNLSWFDKRKSQLSLLSPLTAVLSALSGRQ